MTTEIRKGATAEEIKALLAKKKASGKGLRPFVGKLKRGLDGMTYQNEVRNLISLV
ncbi:hypothetical protein [Spirosoma fluminis]